MDDYGSEDSGAVDPVFNDDSNVDAGWRDISPDFNVLNGGGKGGPASDRSNFSVIDGGKNAERNAEARSVGRAAENGASKKLGDGQDAKGAENSPFTNNVNGKNKEEEKKKKKRRRGLMRMIGPSGILISVLGVAVALVGGSQWLFPFALVSNGLDQFNVLRTSMNRRTNVFMRLQMDSNRPYTAKKYGVFGDQKFQISKGMSKKFARNGIIYTNDADGNKLRLLYYEDDDTGQKIAIAANQDDLDRIQGDTIRVPDADSPDGFKNVEINTKMILTDAIDTNENFKLSQDKATRTLRGHIAGWFDSMSEAFHHKISNTRARFVNTSKTADAEEVQADANKNLLSTSIEDTKPFSPGEEEGTGVENGTKKVKGADGKEIEVPNVEYGGDNPDDPAEMGGSGSLRPGMDEADVRKNLKNRAKNLLAVGQGGQIACMVLKAIGSISMTLGALHIIHILNYVTGFFEAIDQTKAGEGGSVLAYYMGPEGWSNTGPTKDANGDVIEERGDSNAMMARATAAIFGGSPVSPDDKSAEKFNVEYVAKHSINNSMGSGLFGHLAQFGGNIATAFAAYQACNAVKSVVNGINFISTGIDILKFVGKYAATGGPIGVVAAIGSHIIRGVIDIAIMTTAASIVTLMIESVVKHTVEWLNMDLISNMVGEDPSYAMYSGFNIYAGQQMQQSSGLPLTDEQLARQYRETQAVIAEEAEYDRLTHSPFDITNKNTFLGSLAYAAIPIATTMKFSSLFSTVSQVANTAGSSIISLFPSVKAAGDETWYKLSRNTDCPSRDLLPLSKDAFCNPYFGSNYETINYDPARVFDEVCKDSEGRDNFENGCDAQDPNASDDADDDDYTDLDTIKYAYTPEIKEGSDFEKWVVSCPLRESQFGFIDDRIATFNIAEQLGISNPTLSMIVNNGIGQIPLVGDGLDVAEVIKQEKNLKWSTGEGCLTEEAMWYSRYSEDQRLLESMGIIKESSVTVAARRYYEKNPIDYSLEGTIARYSGMNLAQVNEALDVVAYVEYIAEYNPEGRGPLLQDLQDFDDGILSKDDSESTKVYVLYFTIDSVNITYGDLRGRVYTV